MDDLKGMEVRKETRADPLQIDLDQTDDSVEKLICLQ